MNKQRTSLHRRELDITKLDQARLCHARASTTLNVFAHTVPGGGRSSAEALWQRVEAARASVSTQGQHRNPTVRQAASDHELVCIVAASTI